MGKKQCTVEHKAQGNHIKFPLKPLYAILTNGQHG